MDEGKGSFSRNGERGREHRLATSQMFQKEVVVVVVVLEEGATIVRGYFAKIFLLLPPSLARSQAA